MSDHTQDSNTLRSTHQAQVGGRKVVPTPVGSTNPLQIRGDYGVWDTVANKFVLIDQTTIGTTTLPKL